VYCCTVWHFTSVDGGETSQFCKTAQVPLYPLYVLLFFICTLLHFHSNHSEGIGSLSESLNERITSIGWVSKLRSFETSHFLLLLCGATSLVFDILTVSRVLWKPAGLFKCEKKKLFQQATMCTVWSLKWTLYGLTAFLLHHILVWLWSEMVAWTK
jgi:hypothetical protein